MLKCIYGINTGERYSIVVTISFKRINKVGNKKDLNSRRQKIILEMRNNPNITTAEFHAILGVSETAVEKNIIGNFIKLDNVYDVLQHNAHPTYSESEEATQRFLEILYNKKRKPDERAKILLSDTM